MYYIGEDELYCIPTAEVPVTNLHRDEILDAARSAVKYCAYSACFRREAGSYGKDTKGFLRVHQFNKVELVKFVVPERPTRNLKLLRADAEGILSRARAALPGFAAVRRRPFFRRGKMLRSRSLGAGRKKFLEVSSCSNFEDFQARRMNIRFRPQAQ